MIYLQVILVLTLLSTACRFCQTGPNMSKSISGDSVDGEEGSQAQAKTKREINRATLKLDWVLGDDPSQVVIPGSPPGVDTPAFFTAGDPAGTDHVVLETIEEQEEAVPARAIQRISSVGTWPRMRQPTHNRPPITGDLAISVESVVDSGVYKCGSTETGLSSVTAESALPKVSEQAIMTNLDKGTQTDFNVVEVHATVQEGRIRKITYVQQYIIYLVYLRFHCTSAYQMLVRWPPAGVVKVCRSSDRAYCASVPLSIPV